MEKNTKIVIGVAAWLVAAFGIYKYIQSLKPASTDAAASSSDQGGGGGGGASAVDSPGRILVPMNTLNTPNILILPGGIAVEIPRTGTTLPHPVHFQLPPPAQINPPVMPPPPIQTVPHVIAGGGAAGKMTGFHGVPVGQIQSHIPLKTI